MNALNDKMLDKVRKLLALAERAGTESEADAAMGRVQEILAKYNLDINDARTEAPVGMVEEAVDVEWNQTWLKFVATGVGKLYFCRVLCMTQGTNFLRLFFIGRPVNIQTARYVFETIARTGKKLALEFAQQQKALGFNSVSSSNNFRKGFGARILTRCLDLIKDAEKNGLRDSDTGSLLPVVSLYDQERRAAEDFTNQQGRRVKDGGGLKGTNYGQMAAGASAADDVNLRAAGVNGPKGLYLSKS